MAQNLKMAAPKSVYANQRLVPERPVPIDIDMTKHQEGKKLSYFNCSKEGHFAHNCCTPRRTIQAMVSVEAREELMDEMWKKLQAQILKTNTEQGSDLSKCVPCTVSVDTQLCTVQYSQQAMHIALILCALLQGYVHCFDAMCTALHRLYTA